MIEYEGMHDLWETNTIVLGPDDEATTVALGNTRVLLQETSVVHLLIRTAMATSLMSYQFKKMKRKS